VDAAGARARAVELARTAGRLARDWEREARYPRRVAAESGLTGLFCPRPLGGLELSYAEAMPVFEELGRGDAAFAFSLSMHNAVAAAVATAGGEALVAAHGEALAAGRELGGFSLTEPQAGSDATAIRTLAERDGDGWRVSGRKAWVSLAGEADLFLVVCKTSPEPGHRDIALLAVEREQPGVSFPRRYETAAAAFLPIGEMALDGARGELLVPPGEGMRAALAAIDVARCDIAAIAAGLHAEALDVALRYAAERQAFGRPVLSFQGIQWALADVATDLEASRLLYARAASLLGAEGGRVAVAHAKRFCPDAALRAAVACSEVLGAYGWLHEHPLARFLAEAKMLQVVDGTAEVQRIVIARDLERRAAEPAARSSARPEPVNRRSPPASRSRGSA
jgi:alkylation response protein AidB-like acyl-CoA dehydrogenase